MLLSSTPTSSSCRSLRSTGGATASATEPATGIARSSRSVRRKQVRVIGVAYAIQEERLIPNEPHDEPVDLILTDRNVLLCQS